MNVAVSVWDHVLRIAFLFAYALLFAAVEIEIEGPHGWAERLPTWFRVTPLYARVYGILMRGKPLTGYHLVMFVLPLWSFHIGFIGGVPWSWAAEATTLSAYIVWVAIWDLLWFVLNPRFGWKRFRRDEVWWHARAWIGRFPTDYYSAMVTSFLVAATGVLSTGTTTVVVNHAVFTAGMSLLTVLCVMAAPAYMRWYAHMRRPGSDERSLALPPVRE
ncbi:MAG: hypothetical protein H7X95_11570 [Deltaproteobacteria bacterium]|nr:hypothetical protein [Deltaproteobacteria bacterium]